MNEADWTSFVCGELLVMPPGSGGIPVARDSQNAREVKSLYSGADVLKLQSNHKGR